jgi:hypothetical protein
MGIEHRADSLELADVLVAEGSWNERQLITYAVAHRGPRVGWMASTRKTGGTRRFISGSSSEILPFGSRSYAIWDEN